MPVPQLPPYQTTPNYPPYPGNGGAPQLPPYQPTPNYPPYPGGGAGTPPTLPGPQQYTGGWFNQTPAPTPTPTPPTSPQQQYSWNPFGQYNAQWSGLPEYGTGYNANWRPDGSDWNASEFYNLMVQGDEVANNQYAQMLANSLLSGGLFNPYAQDVYHSTLAPTVGYNWDDPTANLAYSDTQAQNWNTSNYWDAVEGNLNSYLTNTFGGDFTDQTAGAQDPIEIRNDWLQDVIAAGRNFASDDPSSYWSTSRRRRRDNEWERLMGAGQALGLDEEFMNLGANLWGQNMGSGMTDYNPMGTGAFGNYLGRRRNSAYS
jgi:hypothetical protein